MSAVPSLDPDEPLKDVVSGEVANPVDPPSGCRFHPRCPLRRALGSPQICVDEEPPLVDVVAGHAAACHFAGQTAGATGDGPAKAVLTAGAAADTSPAGTA